MATVLVALAIVPVSASAARAPAQAADTSSTPARLAPLPPPLAAPAPESPFPAVALEPDTPRGSRLVAYLTMTAGAALVGASFALSHEADRSYDAYLGATELDEIDRLYDRATRYDRLASGALLGGQALVATGVWMRFLRRPAASRLAAVLEPDRWALVVRF